ncbi:hypothetical protein I302_101470 [Kwoniella bestiolae CBS 10118]|uniref:Uncharacterized protein n=1 Tax=Kwoniella bestiolae CBS 10118 TaxID=1296100 RepID=A0A1B9GCB1_9TREE|nr:hypothetical protein I302_00153 [Kwoniella bestiolae CBS 10118]OCF28664.1 hypothetical protein I302_00153 [Kwoniella bestiolae CBS 10118]
MSVAEELARVRFEPRRDQDDRSDTSSIAGSEDESVPSSDDGAGDYEVDAIKWAKYRNSKRDRQDGWVGWHYGVIWNGYLKTGSETEEPLHSFTVEQGQPNLVREFWRSLNIPVGRGRREPAGKIGDCYETPSEQLRQWFNINRTQRDGVRYKRSYETYKRRRAKELRREMLEKEFREIPHDLYTKKADSDYYLFKKLLKERRRRARDRAANPQLQPSSARNSRSTTPASSRAVASGPAIPAPVTMPQPSTSSNAVVSLGSPASEFGSEFNSDREGVEEELEAASSDDEAQEPRPSSSKRKAPPVSSEASTSASASTSTSQLNRDAKRARNEERTARLANAGKISKRVVSPPPTSSGVTFGALQEGIFDENPATSAVAPASAPIPVPAPVFRPAPTAPSAPPASTSRISQAAATTGAVNNVARTPSTTSVPSQQPVNAVKAILSRIEAQQAASAKVAPGQLAQAGSASSADIQDYRTSPTAGHNAEPVTPHTSLPQSSTVDDTSIKPTILPPKPNTSSAGPVPGFNPAPVAGSSAKGRLPLLDKPKYVQPKKIQMIDDVVDRRAARRPGNANVDDGNGRHRPPPVSTLPQRPTSAFVPRQNQSNQALNGAGGSSPNTIQSPTIPTGPAVSVQLPADPRRRAAAQATQVSHSYTAAQNSLPTPATTPIQTVKDSVPVNFSLNAIDGDGGLVTFSPQLILRSPGTFINVMKFCMTHPHWAAYLTPAAMEFINIGWSNRQLCPDATQAYSVLVQFLPLDDQLRDLAGAGITSGGGLCISCCPPNPYQADDCVKWKTWLHDVCATTDYQELVTLCEKYNQKLGPTFPMVIKESNLARMEELQINDLKNLRARHVTDHTRFVYVTPERKISATEGIEYISVDDFINNLASGN